MTVWERESILKTAAKVFSRYHKCITSFFQEKALHDWVPKRDLTSQASFCIYYFGILIKRFSIPGLICYDCIGMDFTFARVLINDVVMAQFPCKERYMAFYLTFHNIKRKFNQNANVRRALSRWKFKRWMLIGDYKIPQ